MRSSNANIRPCKILLRRFVAGCLIVSSWVGALIAADRPKSEARVLFLGNSVFNYRGGVCQSFEGFCREAGLKWDAVSQWTEPENVHGIEFLNYGRIPLSLPEVAGDERIHSLIRKGNFDYVVLEARRPGYLVPEWVGRPEALKLGEHIPYERNLASLKSLHRTIAGSGAQTILYQHPGHHRLEGWKLPVARIYERFQKDLEGVEIGGRTHSVLLVPASFLWLDARKRFDLEEWYSDSNHGTALARYASACLLFTYITKRDPRSVSYRELPRSWTASSGSKTSLAPREAADWIKHRAWFYFTSE